MAQINGARRWVDGRYLIAMGCVDSSPFKNMKLIPPSAIARVCNRILAGCALYLITGLLATAALKVGDPYQAVIDALGPADGEVSMGARTILSYGPAQVKLKEGKVYFISDDLEQKLEQRVEHKADVAQYRADGLINFRGEWVRPEERTRLLKQEQKDQMVNAVAGQVGQGQWLTNFAQAQAFAQSSQRKMLLNFTGSDWCGWCIRLDEEVFSKSQFIDYAKEHYVLVKLDFPKRSKLSSNLKTQNEGLAQQYGIRGFPTIIVLNANGKVHKKGGYVKGGPKAFLKSIR